MPTGADAQLEYSLTGERADNEKSRSDLGDFLTSTVGKYGSVVRDASDRVTGNEGHAKLKEHTVDMLQADRARRMEAIERRIREREKVLTGSRQAQAALSKGIDLKPDTRKDLGALQASETAYKTVAELARMQNNPYSENPEEEILDTKELVRLRASYAALERLNTEEWVDTMSEDKDFIDALAELRTGVPTPKDGIVFLDRGKLNPQEYKRQLAHLMNFILGRPEPEHDSKEKSSDRQQFEVFLWIEIVKRLNFTQKIDLVGTFLEEEGVDAAKKFIGQMIVAGAMNRSEVHEMLGDKERGEKFTTAFGPDFDDYLKGAAIARGDVMDAADDYAKQIEQPKIQNAAVYFFTFDKMIAETVGRLGAITSILGGLTNIFTAIKNKKPGEDWGETIGKGFKDAMTDPYVIGGAAVAYVGSNVVWPYGKEMINAPGSVEKELLEKHGEAKYVEDIAKNRHEVIDALVPRYDEFLEIAKKNLDDGKPDPKTGKKKYSFDVWPDDFDLKPEEAGKMGCRNVDEAKALLIRLFGSCSKVLKLKGDEKIDSADKLGDYLEENVYKDTENDPSHKHAQ